MDGKAAHRRRVQRALERFVHVGADVQQCFHEGQRGQLVGMIRLHPGCVFRAHIGRAVMHVNGEEQSAVVGVGAEIEQRLSPDRSEH